MPPNHSLHRDPREVTQYPPPMTFPWEIVVVTYLTGAPVSCRTPNFSPRLLLRQLGRFGPGRKNGPEGFGLDPQAFTWPFLGHRAHTVGRHRRQRRVTIQDQRRAEV